MGNSPSKNDPLPTGSSTSQSNNQTSGVTSVGDSEQEESSALSGLSSLQHGRPRASLAIHIMKNGVFSDNSANISNNGSENTSFASKHKRRGDESSPRKLISQGISDLDLEIGISLAQLLGNGSTGFGYKISSSLQQDLSSSLESEKSEIFSVSPATALGESKDVELLLSVGSPNSDYVRHDQNKLDKALGTICEQSTESTPEPKNSSVGDSTNIKEAKDSDIYRSSLVGNFGTSFAKTRSRSSGDKSEINVDEVIDRLLGTGFKNSRHSRSTKDRLPLSGSEIKYILHKSRSIFLSQPTLLRLSPPVKIVGDIHGQYDDLLRIFNSCGYPPYTNYLFLGDYVDRGHKSLETILLLLCFKIKYPENFFMLRGNHESANITKIYGFYDECKRRLLYLSSTHKLWKVFIDVFNTLPIAATINDKIFCIHGGLSPQLEDLSQIESIKRPTDIPDKGLLTDLLWSDPDPLIRSYSTNWPKNDRGVSYCFGKKHVDYFCNKFNIDLIVRGHMVVEDGYEFFDKRKFVTVFLAPNYCGDFNNYGAVMSVDKTLCCSFELLKPL